MQNKMMLVATIISVVGLTVVLHAKYAAAERRVKVREAAMEALKVEVSSKWNWI
jgi:hypothetical protein